jgi:hypothetical protein
MIFRNEIKDFIKNTLILTLFFTLVLHLSWGYVFPYISWRVNAGNDTKFQTKWTPYLWNIATAVSLSVWQKDKWANSSLYTGNSSLLSIAEVLSRPAEWQKRLIGGNMASLQAYAHLLETDIVKMLDAANDRWVTLDEHISILRDYGNKTNERLKILEEQINELDALIAKSNDDTNGAKSVLESSFANLDYNGVDDAIDTYTKAKSEDNRARVYLVYLEKFKKAYTLLQAKNKKLLEALVSNRDALIRRTTVVIPSSGTNILKELWIVESQSDYEAKKVLQ